VPSEALAKEGFNREKPMIRLVFAVALLVAGTFASTPALAQSVADFYRGKTIEIIVGYAPGGGYDQAARVLARHMGRHVPGTPAFIVRNMPGAGSVLAANHVNNVAAKDGTVIGIYADILPVAKLLEIQGVQFDPKNFGWLGSVTSRGYPVLVIRSDAPATTLAGIREKEVLIGAAGPDATSSYALMLNELVGTKLKVLAGYSGGTAEIDLAIQRGEVHGRASADWERVKQLGWIQSGLAKVVLQVSLRPSPELKDVPVAIDQVRSDEDRQVMELVLGSNQFFRAFSTPPGVPADRLAALREAFARTVGDPEFVKEFTAASPIDFSTPRQIEEFIERVTKFPPKVIKRASKFVTT
jgi:tripartite-type tricarboxylate transporter receptor subunit TctC